MQGIEMLKKRERCHVCYRRTDIGKFQMKFHINVESRLIVYKEKIVMPADDCHDKDDHVYDLILCGNCSHKVMKFFDNVTRRKGIPHTKMIGTGKIRKLFSSRKMREGKARNARRRKAKSISVHRG